MEKNKMKTQTMEQNEKAKMQPKFQVYEPISGRYISITNPLLLLDLKLSKAI